MDKVRIGIIGIGNMGTGHVRNLMQGLVPRMELAAVADLRADRRAWAKENPDLRVSDIAYQVGFKDPKYFATSFKRVTGMQPKESIMQARVRG